MANISLFIRNYLFTLLLLTGNGVYSQQSSKKDSLLQILNTKKISSQERVDILNTLSFYYKENKDSLQLVLSEARLLSKEINYTYGTARNLFVEGKTNKGDYKKSIELILQAQKLYQDIDSIIQVGQCDYRIAQIYFKNYQSDKMLPYLEKAYSIFDKENNLKWKNRVRRIYAGYYIRIGDFNNGVKVLKEGLKNASNDKEKSGFLYNLGVFYTHLDNFSLAIEAYENAIEIYKKAEDKKGLMDSYNALGVIITTKNTTGLERAIKYHTKAIDIAKEIDNQDVISINLYNIGLTYQKLKDYNKAVIFFNKSLAYAEKNKDLYSIAYNEYGIGNVLVKQNNYEEGIKHLDKAYSIIIKQDDILTKCDIEDALARAYLGLNKLDKALNFALNTLQIANKLDKPSYKIDAYELLSKIYAQKNQYKKAFENHTKYTELHDSMNSEKGFQKIAKIEAKYEYKEKLRTEKEAKEVLQTQNDSLEHSKKYLLIAINGLLLLGLIFTVYTYRLKNKKIRAENKRISLEQKLLRTQMTPHFVFNSLAVLQGIIMNKEYKKSITYLSKFSRLLRIVLENSRKSFVSLESEVIAIENYLIVQKMGNNIPEEYKISIADTIDKENLLIPPMMIQPFVENSIEHGFTINKKNSAITIDIKLENDKLIVKIEDNGIGIASAKAINNKKKSLATTITKERIAVFKEEYRMDATISITNISENGKSGTLVRLVLPYKIN